MPLLPTIDPGPFAGLTTALNLACVGLMGILLFIAITIGVCWLFEMRNGTADTPAPQTTRHERRRLEK